MNRILFEHSEIRPDGLVAFGGARASHVMEVLHGEAGQVLKTGEVGGKIGFSTIKSIADLGMDAEGRPTWRLTVECRHDSEPLLPWCDLVLAPPRPRVMKRLLPQLATLGVRRIFLVGAEKVEKAFWGAQLLRPEIYRPLLIDGLMQGAVATEPPTIVICRNFRQWLQNGNFDEDFVGQPFRVVAHPPTEASGMVTVPASAPGTVPVFAIGPEGGWTEAEVALLEAKGFVRRSLGARILKTETATVALLARFIV